MIKNLTTARYLVSVPVRSYVAAGYDADMSIYSIDPRARELRDGELPVGLCAVLTVEEGVHDDETATRAATPYIHILDVEYVDA
jgi:hypothetical protein